MSDRAYVQPQEVGGVEQVVLGSSLQEVDLLIPDHVEVSVVTDPGLGVLPLLLRPLLL